MDLDADLTTLKGVGPKTAELLRLAGICTVRDLLYFLPRDYSDFSLARNLRDVVPGQVVVKATIDDIKFNRYKRRNLTSVEGSLHDETGAIRVIWFNQPYREKQFLPGREYYFMGEFQYNRGRYQLMNPMTEDASRGVEGIEGDRMVPIYSAVRGFKSAATRKVIRQLKMTFGSVPEVLPESVVRAAGLLARGDALYRVHFPDSQDDIMQARHRLAFEEMFLLILASALNKQENQRLKAQKSEFDQKLIKDFVAKLPFKLTDAQRLAAWEILLDLGKGTPMNRLLQGDVGSGKTVVAGIGILQTVKAGFQAALMAPTEILARQHGDTLEKLLKPFGVEIAVLTAATKGKVELKRRIAAGEVDVVVGTHAMLTDDVGFARLNFVTIDEQHRFGVGQRQKLVSKANGGKGRHGDWMPHILTMTATPIPRSLQLTMFGELDVSILNQLPGGRKPVASKVVKAGAIHSVYEHMNEELDAGHQVYYICNLIEESAEGERKAVESEKKVLERAFRGRKIGLLHGRMKPAEKEAVMSDFLAGKIEILVSTTVVEVGVDVRNATLMVIADADRFGMSQLHQLRGRVGRSDLQSFCYLVTSEEGWSPRLREVERTNDGFKLAERDLALRGPGEIYGRLQHGVLDLRIATITDTKLIAEVQRAVRLFIESGESVIQYRELADSVKKYQRLTVLN